MLKFAIVVVLLIMASIALTSMASEYQKSYREPTEGDRKNTRIDPFYGLWAWIGMTVASILVVSTVACKIKGSGKV